ncbi:MAG: FtsQ-type POTRA domain-containing protein [Gammaproteobacteria bacterium]|nr:FtsQ-type POTRA domain-containing protein [Gammaproteobacteria bacterium]
MSRRALAELEYQARRAKWQWFRRSSVMIVAIALTATALLAVAADRLFRPTAFPVDRIALQGEFKRVDPQRLREAIAAHVRGNFFAIDLREIEAAARRVDWVNRATVRRIWPRGVQVSVDEQRPVARWGPGAWLNEAGDVIRFSGVGETEALIALSGPDESGQLVLQRYREWARLLQAINLEVVRVDLSPRFAWTVAVRDGDSQAFELVLGTQNMDLRLARFIRSFPISLTPEVARIQRVDLRYTNGYAVSWRPQMRIENDAS